MLNNSNLTITVMRRKLIISLFTACAISAQASFNGQGSGTERDPYQITNADQLFSIRNELSASYVLVNDINLTDWISDENIQQGWNPIGTQTTPFTGTFDGGNFRIKGLFVNTPQAEAVGLFGYTKEATIRNLILINPLITGGTNTGSLVGIAEKTNINHISIIGAIVSGTENVGALVGYMFIGGNGYVISDNIIAGGKIYGSNFAGGMIGRIKAADVYSSSNSSRVPEGETIGSYSYEVSYNHCSAMVESKDIAGGIIGSTGGFFYYGGNGEGHGYAEAIIHDNQFEGRITDGKQVGGITGNIEVGSYCRLSYARFVNGEWTSYYGKPYFKFSCNLVGGSLHGQNVQGVLYLLGDKYEASLMSKNVCYSDTVCSTESIPLKISAVADENNYSSISTILIHKDRVISADYSKEQGSSLGNRTLKVKGTYEGLGFDFSKRWTIEEGETFPYLLTQSAPPTITSFVSGSRALITGTSSNTGKVYVLLGGSVYEGNVIDGKWDLYLGYVNVGVETYVTIQQDGLMPSILSSSQASALPTPPAKKGDANGDGVIDAVDVTAIINYILGKPSPSFNRTNADVNGDGKILIDDAVQTVQMIMDAQ